MNQIAETLHATLDSRSFNRLILYEQDKYPELEQRIEKDEMDDFIKDSYKIPVIPEQVEETPRDLY